MRLRYLASRRRASLTLAWTQSSDAKRVRYLETWYGRRLDTGLVTVQHSVAGKLEQVCANAARREIAGLRTLPIKPARPRSQVSFQPS